jgi:vacuolar-type H+-ATPase subunit E/Vma4
MALSALIARLEQEAGSQVQAIQREAEAELRAIEAATERAVADATARLLERERSERQIVRQRELTLARRQARERELEALRAQVSRIFERARALLPEIAASASYRDALPSHLEEALSYLDGLRPRVRCQAVFAPMLRAAIERREGVELVVDESVGPGVVAEAADGSVVVNNTLAGRLARAQAWLAIELSVKLGDGRH